MTTLFQTAAANPAAATCADGGVSTGRPHSQKFSASGVSKPLGGAQIDHQSTSRNAGPSERTSTSSLQSKANPPPAPNRAESSRRAEPVHQAQAPQSPSSTAPFASIPGVQAVRGKILPHHLQMLSSLLTVGKRAHDALGQLVVTANMEDVRMLAPRGLPLHEVLLDLASIVVRSEGGVPISAWPLVVHLGIAAPEKPASATDRAQRKINDRHGEAPRLRVVFSLGMTKILNEHPGRGE